MIPRKFQKKKNRSDRLADRRNDPAFRNSLSCGVLSLISTPIGNLEDITLRALRRLKEVDLIVAEDTRHTRKLLAHYDIHCPLTSYYKDIEKRKTGELIQLLLTGKQIALVTDAGTPGLSDPGTYMVREAKRHGITIEILPGPSALLTALLGSGLLTRAFSFFGFLEPKSGRRRWILANLKSRQETLVFFVAPHRLAEILQDMQEILGDRQAVLCREMTKIHEEFISGTLSELAEHAKRVSRGEYTLVIAGSSEEIPIVEGSIQSQLDWLQQAEGLTLNQAIARVARSQGLPRAEVYAMVHALDKKSN